MAAFPFYALQVQSSNTQIVLSAPQSNPKQHHGRTTVLHHQTIKQAQTTVNLQFKFKFAANQFTSRQFNNHTPPLQIAGPHRRGSPSKLQELLCSIQ
ncbi:hypothetical protein M0R45_007201 [Rubus argutus]|uniref:Uncharacterized protein n=1 Tax=Rubus argutus TaxID=59490 RepID=A0AAW1XXK3_RUBAR